MRTPEQLMQRLRSRFDEARDLRASRQIDVHEVASVCLTLGPYRNLTTLTAAVLFLHPNCQVLNHAGGRIYGNQQVDFFSDFSPAKLDRFVQYAIKISETGQLGYQGGSITRSHAFASKHKMKEIYEATGSELVKQHIQCLFWKESLRTSNVIRDRHVDLASMFEQDSRLRFLLPIRNPLDCAVSNLKTDHIRLFESLPNNPSTAEVAQAIVDEIYWFAGLKAQFPDRFFYFFEHQIARPMLVDLANFLQLEQNEGWIANALDALEIKPGYEHDDQLIDSYRGFVGSQASEFPEMAQGLMAFVN